MSPIIAEQLSTAMERNAIIGLIPFFPKGLPAMPPDVKQRSASHAIWHFARCFAALVLLSAAALKLQPASPPLEFQGVQVATPLVIVVEVSLAAWLLSGRFPRAARAAALALFATFAGVSTLHAVKGNASCGCLGAAAVPPVWMLTIDTVVLCLLLPSRSAAPRGGPFRVPVMGGLAGAAVIVLAIQMAGRPDAADDDGPLPPRRGERWPIAAASGSPVDLSRGLWYVIVYRSGCPHCRELLSDIVNSDIPTSYRVAFAEIKGPIGKRTNCAGGACSEVLPTVPLFIFRESPNVATPTILLVRDGAVVDSRVPVQGLTTGEVFAAMAEGSI